MKTIVVVVSLLLAPLLHAQLPVIKATSNKVSIKDGDCFNKNGWTLSPETKPDVFTADRSREAKWIVFYTDIDSIKVNVKPGMRFNFVILLNGKDSCYTQVASAITPQSLIKPKVATHDTIPFTLTEYNAIHVKAIINAADTLDLHFDLGSFDFRFIKEAMRPVTKLQMGSLVWHKPEVGITWLTSRGMDGRFGWNLFEGKTVEIDYDKSVIIVHSSLPKNIKNYKRSDLEFKRSFVCVKGSFTIGGKNCEGHFLLDTGSDQAIIVDSA